MKRLCILAVTAQIGLGACTAIESVRPDISARPIPSRLDEIAYINTLRSAFEQDVGPYCFEGNGLGAFKSKSGQGYKQGIDREQFLARANETSGNTCLKFKKLPSDDSGKKELDEYLQAGFGLTDLYCHRFFTVAIASQQNRSFMRSELASADTLVGAVLGFSGASKTAMAVTNSVFGFGTKTLEGYDAAYLVAPDMPDVERLVTAELLRFRENLRKRDTDELPKTYQHARAVIESYARNCSFSGMRQLVSKSIKDRTDDLNKPAITQPAPDNAGGQKPQQAPAQAASGVTPPRPEPSGRPDLASPPPL